MKLFADVICRAVVKEVNEEERIISTEIEADCEKSQNGDKLILTVDMNSIKPKDSDIYYIHGTLGRTSPATGEIIEIKDILYSKTVEIEGDNILC